MKSTYVVVIKDDSQAKNICEIARLSLRFRNIRSSDRYIEIQQVTDSQIKDLAKILKIIKVDFIICKAMRL